MENQSNTQLAKVTTPESRLLHLLALSGRENNDEDKEKTQLAIAHTIFEISATTTMQTAIESPKIKALQKSLGNETIHNILITVLKSFCDAMNVKDSMNATQLVHCAYAYMETFPNNSVKDLILCLKKVQKGDYGQVYNRIDQMVIVDFVRKHEAEKANFLESKHLDYKAQEASNVNAVIASLPEETKQAIKNFVDPRRTPQDKVKPAIISEEEYRMNLISIISQCSEEELHEGIKYFMGKGVKEYILLCQEQLNLRFPKSA